MDDQGEAEKHANDKRHDVTMSDNTLDDSHEKTSDKEDLTT